MKEETMQRDNNAQVDPEESSREREEALAEEVSQEGEEALAEESGQEGEEALAEESGQEGEEALVEEVSQGGEEALAEEVSQGGEEALAEEVSQGGEEALAEESGQEEEEALAEEVSQGGEEALAEELSDEEWDEDVDYEDDTYLEDDSDPEEESEPVKPGMMILVFLGMALLAAVICIVLWNFTHPDKQDTGGQNTTSQGISAESAASSSEPTPAVTPESTSDMTEMSDSQTAQSQPASDASGEADGGDEGQIQEPVSGNESMEFTTVEESVTPKDVTNLRSVPSTLDAENIVVQAQNGEVLTRTGINADTGWSRIDYNGQTLYAVSQYLSTDLNYKAPVQASNPNRVNTLDGRVIIFMDCDDWITPKEYVNLRTEPSTTEGQATVSAQLNYGEKAHRTGYSPDAGWSRVEYDGKVLYVVSSYVVVVKDAEAETESESEAETEVESEAE